MDSTLPRNEQSIALYLIAEISVRNEAQVLDLEDFLGFEFKCPRTRETLLWSLRSLRSNDIQAKWTNLQIIHFVVTVMGKGRMKAMAPSILKLSMRGDYDTM